MTKFWRADELFISSLVYFNFQKLKSPNSTLLIRFNAFYMIQHSVLQFFKISRNYRRRLTSCGEPILYNA